ncbi:MAG TPA: JAB domain-containing protein [Methylomirabilota bacterium]|nr:JAB domain-containing protein [Methylomirabilota bacterium]
MIVLKDTKITASDAKVVAKVFQDLLAVEDAIDQDKEHYYVMHIDSRNKVKLVELVGLGTVNSASVHPRETFTRAVAERSVSIIVAHSHPSGEVEPSEADLKTTSQLQKAGEILGISLLDHIIFSKEKYFSMKENR